MRYRCDIVQIMDQTRVDTRYDVASILDYSHPPHHLRTCLADGPFLNQKTYKGIRISYSLKYKHSKK